MWESLQPGRQARTGTITRTMTRQIIVEIDSSGLTSQKRATTHTTTDHSLRRSIYLPSRPGTVLSGDRAVPSGHRTVLGLRIEARDFATRMASTTELREADPRIESRDFATTKIGIYSTKSRTTPCATNLTPRLFASASFNAEGVSGA